MLSKEEVKVIQEVIEKDSSLFIGDSIGGCFNKKELQENQDVIFIYSNAKKNKFFYFWYLSKFGRVLSIKRDEDDNIYIYFYKDEKELADKVSLGLLEKFPNIRIFTIDTPWFL